MIILPDRSSCFLALKTDRVKSHHCQDCSCVKEEANLFTFSQENFLMSVDIEKKGKENG